MNQGTPEVQAKFLVYTDIPIAMVATPIEAPEIPGLGYLINADSASIAYP